MFLSKDYTQLYAFSRICLYILNLNKYIYFNITILKLFKELKDSSTQEEKIHYCIVGKKEQFKQKSKMDKENEKKNSTGTRINISISFAFSNNLCELQNTKNNGVKEMA